MRSEGSQPVSGSIDSQCNQRIRQADVNQGMSYVCQLEFRTTVM